MAGFVDFATETDVDALIDQAFTNLEARFPGISLNEAHLEVALAEEMSRLVTERNAHQADVAEEIFRTYGEKVAKVLPLGATPATLNATVTAINDAGYVMPIGTKIGFRRSGSEIWIFQSTAEAVIAPGATQALNVPFASLDFTEERNGIAAGSALEMVDPLFWVDSVVSSTVSANGASGETDTEYLDRLSSELGLMAPRPIHPDDFAILARRTAGVHRATAIDGYDPANDTYNNERMVTVAAVDSAGAAVSAAIRDEMRAQLDARREVTFVVNAIDPTFTAIDIVFEATAVRGADVAAVEAAAEQAVKDYIDPAYWSGGRETPPVWRRETTLRYLELATLINNVPGIDRLTLLTIEGVADDFVLPGVAPLPRKAAGGAGDSTVAGTVVA